MEVAAESADIEATLVVSENENIPERPVAFWLTLAYNALKQVTNSRCLFRGTSISSGGAITTLPEAILGMRRRIYNNKAMKLKFRR